MPYARDNLAVLRSNVLADISARLPQSNPYARRSVLNVLGTVIAGHQNDQFGYLDWQAKQAVPFTAQGEYLEGWSTLKGIDYEAPTFASGPVQFTGAADAPVDAGLTLTTQGGILYSVVTGGDLDGSGNGTFTVTAVVAGSAGNLAGGAPLSLQGPQPGIDTVATVGSAGITGGVDLETDDSLRARTQLIYSAPPQGGDLADYVNWAMAVPGVTRAWAAGPAVGGTGTVTVYFMMDNASHTNGLPNGTNGVSQYESRGTAATGDQLAVANGIYSLRPVTALVTAAAPIGDALNLTIAEVPTNLRSEITTAVAAFLVREATPGGVLLPPSLNAGGTVLLSHLSDAISAVAGLDHFVLQSPTADFVSVTGHIANPGTITWT